jgi:hypothetical protein
VPENLDLGHSSVGRLKELGGVAGNVERLRSAFENFLAGSSEFGAELLDPEVVWDATDAAFDSQQVYQGVEGVKQFWRDWLSAWETVQFERPRGGARRPVDARALLGH